MAKSGRKRINFTTSDGETVVGLGRSPAGRWRCLDCQKYLPAEPDERRAVAAYHRHRDEHHARATVGVSLGHVRTLPHRKSPPTPNGLGTLATPVTGDAAATLYEVGQRVPEQAMVDWCRDALTNRPQWLAQRVGIPEVARLADLPKREPSPALASLGDLYLARRVRDDQNERSKSRLYWGEFVDAMSRAGITTARDVTPAAVADFGDSITADPKHRIGKIRTIFRHALKRGKDVRSALDACATLEAPKGKPKDPRPMRRDDFHRLLAAADSRTAAAMLGMLNLCMYPTEILMLEWGDIDANTGGVVTQRSKTGVPRVGVLWGRTLEAMQALPRRGDAVFSSRDGTPLSPHTLRRENWRKLREQVGLPAATMDQIRDSSYTAAVTAGVPFDHARLLAGHRTGMADHYVQRNPLMVKDACAAIERAYFG